MRLINCNKRSLVYILMATVFLIGISSWGFLVHRTLHQLAIYSLPSPLQNYFHTDMKNLVENAARPDTRRNSDKTEATKHFIDLEAYGPNAANDMPLDWASAQQKYTKDTLLKYGWGPYNVMLQLDYLIAAFKSKNKDSILFYAADIGHYIADLNVPLHTTLNYDGQLTGQKGLHSLWESFIPELSINQYQLYNAHKAVFLKDPASALWKNIRQAYQLLPEMLAKETLVSNSFTTEKKYRMQMYYGRNTRMYTKEFAEAYAKELGPTINVQLTASANLIADFWYTAWVKAGKPNFTTRVFSSSLNLELKSFKQNKLIQDSLLLSKKLKSDE